MSILGWVVFGAITGWLASLIVNKRGEGCILNIALGLIGSLVGGAIFRALSNFDVFHFNLTSMFVAVLGAVITLFIWHAITGNRTLR
ncbi:MAG: GlsB/YeaQ/YmgE family stress response membrane protein [Alphaproteobacteria bacterium]|nr:GlsB/YeaQ/YmgE family stress response membrane protein [Alphaproteobacteria bacterium]MBV9542625.1 GlsB/YeaQ/YmgE family stress response membrane protein [Alphaproteobacteria bacterium]MBV9903701.1 GlsB/YeaQ/YmgE family stress response membrane protein [Alphaproteobacteria bacterium]